MSRRIVVALVAGSVLCLAGCGGSSSSSGGSGGDVGSSEGATGATEVVETLAAALPDGDGPRVCSLLSPDTQQALLRHTGTADCIAATTAAARTLSAEQRAALGRTDSLEVEADGDKAVATGEAADVLAAVLGVETATLARVEEHWHLG